jgi:hypothetical protein
MLSQGSQPVDEANLRDLVVLWLGERLCRPVNGYSRVKRSLQEVATRYCKSQAWALRLCAAKWNSVLVHPVPKQTGQWSFKKKLFCGGLPLP